MGRQRNNPQRKENETSPEKELNEMEACNLSEKELRIRVIQFINWRDEKINNLCKNQEKIKSDIASIKKHWKISID